MKKFAGFLRNPIHKPLPNWSEFNPYHKFWAAYLSVVIPLLGLTGIINIFGPGILGKHAAGVGSYIHVTLALITDLLVIIHLYFKLIRWLYRDVSDSVRAIRNNGSLNHFVLYYHNRER
jgi:thiosulfate reductase cytochrome b subunit